jgi:hypothetical protein
MLGFGWYHGYSILFYIVQCIKHGERSSSLNTSSIPKGARRGIIFHIKLDEAYSYIYYNWVLKKILQECTSIYNMGFNGKNKRVHITEFTDTNTFSGTHLFHNVIVLKKTIHQADT